LGRATVSSLSREPKPPARITAFTALRLLDAPHGHSRPQRSSTPTRLEDPAANGKSDSRSERTRNW
jgi:hypothetical protein